MSKEYKASIEIVRRIYDDNEGVCIEVSPDCDALGGIEIKTVDKHSIEYFGKHCLRMYNKEMVKKLGEALIEASKEMK